LFTLQCFDAVGLATRTSVYNIKSASAVAKGSAMGDNSYSVHIRESKANPAKAPSSVALSLSLALPAVAMVLG